MEKLTLAELKSKAKEKGISGYSKMKKQELIDILSKKSSKKKSSEKGKKLQFRLDEIDKLFDEISQMEDISDELKVEFEKVLNKSVRKLISQLIKAYDENAEMDEMVEIENKVAEKLEQALELINYHMEKSEFNKINRIKSDISFITSFISFVYGFNFSKSLANKSLKKNTQKVKEFLDEIHEYENQLDNNEISLKELENNLKRIVGVVVNDSAEYIQQTKESLNKLFTSMKPDLELFNMKNEYKLIRDELDNLTEKLDKLDELSLRELADINRIAISIDNDISNTIEKLNEKIRKSREDDIMEGNCSGSRDTLIGIFDYYKMDYDEYMTDKQMCDIIFKKTIEEMKDYLERHEKIVCPEDVDCRFTREDYWYKYFLSKTLNQKIPKQTYTNFFKRGIVDPMYAKNLIKLFLEIFPALNDKIDSEPSEQAAILDVLYNQILQKLSNYSIEQLKDYILTPMLDMVESKPPSPKRKTPSPKRTPSPKVSPKKPKTPSPPKMTEEERKARISERKKKRSDREKKQREKEEQRKAKYQKEKAEKLKEKEAEAKRKRDEDEAEEREMKLSPKMAEKVKKEHEEFLQKVKRKVSPKKPASPKFEEIRDELQFLVEEKIRSGVEPDEAIELSGKIADAKTKAKLEEIRQEIQKLRVKTPPRKPSPKRSPSPKKPSPKRTPSPVDEEYVPVRSRASPPKVRDIMRSAVTVTPPPEEEVDEEEEEYIRPKLDIDAAFDMLEDF